MNNIRMNNIQMNVAIEYAADLQDKTEDIILRKAREIKSGLEFNCLIPLSMSKKYQPYTVFPQLLIRPVMTALRDDNGNIVYDKDHKIVLQAVKSEKDEPLFEGELKISENLPERSTVIFIKISGRGNICGINVDERRFDGSDIHIKLSSSISNIDNIINSDISFDIKQVAMYVYTLNKLTRQAYGLNKYGIFVPESISVKGCPYTQSMKIKVYLVRDSDGNALDLAMTGSIDIQRSIPGYIESLRLNVDSDGNICSMTGMRIDFDNHENKKTFIPRYQIQTSCLSDEMKETAALIVENGLIVTKNND